MMEMKTRIHCGVRESGDLVTQTTTPTVNDKTLRNQENVSSRENVISAASKSQYVENVSTETTKVGMVDGMTEIVAKNERNDVNVHNEDPVGKEYMYTGEGKKI